MIPKRDFYSASCHTLTSRHRLFGEERESEAVIKKKNTHTHTHSGLNCVLWAVDLARLLPPSLLPETDGLINFKMSFGKQKETLGGHQIQCCYYLKLIFYCFALNIAYVLKPVFPTRCCVQISHSRSQKSLFDRAGLHCSSNSFHLSRVASFVRATHPLAQL